MIRLDMAGRDVTDSPGLWSEEDVEIIATNYPHPTITTGQHTNGPAIIWLKRCLDDAEWINTGMIHMHKVRALWETRGKEWVDLLRINSIKE